MEKTLYLKVFGTIIGEELQEQFLQAVEDQIKEIMGISIDLAICVFAEAQVICRPNKDMDHRIMIEINLNFASLETLDHALLISYRDSLAKIVKAIARRAEFFPRKSSIITVGNINQTNE